MSGLTSSNSRCVPASGPETRSQASPPVGGTGGPSVNGAQLGVRTARPRSNGGSKAGGGLAACNRPSMMRIGAHGGLRQSARASIIITWTGGRARGRGWFVGAPNGWADGRTCGDIPGIIVRFHRTAEGASGGIKDLETQAEVPSNLDWICRLADGGRTESFLAKSAFRCAAKQSNGTIAEVFRRRRRNQRYHRERHQATLAAPEPSGFGLCMPGHSPAALLAKLLPAHAAITLADERSRGCSGTAGGTF